jgi:uncharacterized protein YbjQ (UPF0145 family)
MTELVALGVPLVLVLVGLIFGRANERRHLQQLAQRERRLEHFLITDLRSYAADADPQQGATIVVAEAVIATDYLKTLLALVRNIVGGEVQAYGTLVMRARREATLRLVDQARAKGLNAICNLRLEMADIGGTAGGRGIPLAAVLASGTAYRRQLAEGHPYRETPSS